MPFRKKKIRICVTEFRNVMVPLWSNLSVSVGKIEI